MNLKINLDNAIRKLKAMTKNQFFDSLVEAGIIDKSGKLKKKYKIPDSKNKNF